MTLHRAAAHLAANSGLTSALGVAYWVLAARLLTPREVGRGSALMALIWSLSAFSQMNFNVSVSRILPGAGAHAARVVAWVYAATIAMSVVVASVVMIASPSTFDYLSSVPAAPVLLGLAVAVWTVFALEDSVLATMRRTSIIPIENAIFGAAKLIVLLALLHAGVTNNVIGLSWIAPLAVIVVSVNVYLFGAVLPRAPADGKRPPLGRGSRSGIGWYDYAGSLAWLAGTLTLPVFVASLVGSAREATFYVPYTVAITIDLVSINLGNALTAEAIRTRDRRDQRARIGRFLRTFGLTLCVCVAFGVLASPAVLAAFGSHYRHTGAWAMRIMLVAVIPRAALFLSLAIARSTGRGLTITTAQALTAGVTLGVGVVLLHRIGVAGMAIAWLIGSCCGAGFTTIRVTIPFLREIR